MTEFSSKVDWLKSLKPGDSVASRWRTKNVYTEERIRQVLFDDNSVESRISCQLEDGTILDSFWINHVSAVEC